MKLTCGFIAMVSCMLSVGCKSKNTSDDECVPTVEITFNEERNETTKDFIKLLLFLSENGHCRILINGTYVYLPPIGEPPSGYPTNTNNVFIADFSAPSCPVELSRIKKWIKQDRIDGVSILLARNLDYKTILSLIDLFNEQDVHYHFASSQMASESKTTIMERNQVEQNPDAASGTRIESLP